MRTSSITSVPSARRLPFRGIVTSAIGLSPAAVPVAATSARSRRSPSAAGASWSDVGMRRSWARNTTSDEAERTRARACRSWSHTDVRSAPKRRFAPPHSASSPAESVVLDTSRANVCSSSRSCLCRSISPAARARSSAMTKACPTEAASIQLLGRGRRVASNHQQANRLLPLCERDQHGLCVTEHLGHDRADARDVVDHLRRSVSEQPFGNHSPRPNVVRQAIETKRRGGVQEIAPAAELKEDRAPAHYGGYGVIVEHRKQVAEPFGGRQRLE